ncbi:MAG: hypothetical protein ABIQ35_15335 [Verrucomicrobiota bacterium]
MFERARFFVFNPLRRLAIPILAIFVVSLAGCKKQPDANAELANAVKALEKADTGQNPAPTPAPAASADAVSSQPVARQMSEAMTAYKSGNYDDAMSRLHLLRSRAAKTPEQTMAVQDAMAAVMTELYDRASKGDTKAQQAIKQYQENRNNR